MSFRVVLVGCGSISRAWLQATAVSAVAASVQGQQLVVYGGESMQTAVSGVTQRAFEQYHKIAFRFLRWIRPERLAGDLRKMFAKRNVQVIAPIHGNAIRGDIQIHLDRMIAALTAVKESYQ